MWDSISEFKILGNGFPLYFYFKKYAVVICLLWSLIVSIPWIIINRAANDPENGVGKFNTNKDLSFFAHCSLGNHGNNPDFYEESKGISAIIALNIAFIGILIVASLIFDRYQIKMDRKFDEENITASDFTVIVSNLPLDVTSTQLKEWLIESHEWKDIIEIVMCYHIKAIINLNNQLESQKQIRGYLISK